MQHTALKTFALALALCAATAGVAAQDVASGWNPRSGDAWVDMRLGDINQYGSRYRESFVDEMTRYYGAPRDLISDLLVNRGWAPGDVYYACAIAQVIGRPCRHVVDQWDRDHGQGWGALAERLGIQAGSAEFHRLKRGFVPTYDRWNRPIALDDDLRRDFPNRGKGATTASGRGSAESAASSKAHSQGQPAKPDAQGPSGRGKQGEPRGNDAGGGDGKPRSHGNGNGNR